MFELTSRQINAVISKMILNDELKASWDKPTELLVLHRAESTKLQSLAKQTADKVCFSNLAEFSLTVILFLQIRNF